MKKGTFKRAVVGFLTCAVLATAAPETIMPQQSVTVEAAQVKLNKKKLTLKKGASKKLKLVNASGKIKWKSNHKNIASVSAKGVVKAKKAGKAVISATYKKKTYKCTVTVTNPKKKKPGKTGGSTGTVYWVPSGKVYHVSRNCPTLSRSKTVYSGSVSDCGNRRACKVCS